MNSKCGSNVLQYELNKKILALLSMQNPVKYASILLQSLPINSKMKYYIYLRNEKFNS